MSLTALENDGFIKRYKMGKKQIEQQMELANRDFSVAKDTRDYDWAFSILYNAVLQAGRALMFYFGWRPTDKEPHKSVMKFLREVMDKKELEALDFFDKMRIKRHQAVYDHIGVVSKEELNYSFKLVSGFISMAIKMISMAN